MNQTRGTPKRRKTRRQPIDYDLRDEYGNAYRYVDPADKSRSCKPESKQTEFFKLFLIACIVIAVVIVAAMVTMNFWLLLHGLEPMQQEVVTAITVFGGILAGGPPFAYAGLNAIRAWSLNKHVTGAAHNHDEDTNIM